MWEQELALEHEEHVATKAALEVTKLHAKAAEAQADAAAERKKSKGVNIHSHVLTCLEGQAAWEELQQEEARHQAEHAAKDRDKEADQRAQTTEQIHNAVLQVFDHPLMYYKKKEALHLLVLALELDDNGKVIELQGCIKAHMQAHPELTTNPRFAGLYANRRTCATHCASQVSTVGTTPSTGSCSGVPQPPPEPLRLRPISPPCDAGPSVGPMLMLGPTSPQRPPNPPGNDPIPEVHPGHPWPPLVPGPNLHVPAEEWHWDGLTAGRRNSPLSVALAPGLGTHPHMPHAYPSAPYPPTSFHAHAGVYSHPPSYPPLPTPTWNPCPSSPTSNVMRQPPPLTFASPPMSLQGARIILASNFTPFAMGPYPAGPSSTHSGPSRFSCDPRGC
ncbi:hypothetical protein K439DRAFT_1611952 [Ramaria rubella]|nr:hypothetical protein K439DRAFT_1611952 [Ramaria rubella]